jgi:hypothetical protein
MDGSLRISTILELAREQEVVLPAEDADGLRKILEVPRLQEPGRISSGLRYHPVGAPDSGSTREGGL